MKRILLIVRSDPRTSHRPCEGIRIGLGLAAGGHAVTVVLSGAGIRLLWDDPLDQVDGETAQHYLTTLHAFIPLLYLDDDPSGEAHPTAPAFPVRPLSKREIAEKLSGADLLLTF